MGFWIFVAVVVVLVWFVVSIYNRLVARATAIRMRSRRSTSS